MTEMQQQNAIVQSCYPCGFRKKYWGGGGQRSAPHDGRSRVFIHCI